MIPNHGVVVSAITTVGLTAGASTPGWIIDEVKSRLEGL